MHSQEYSCKPADDEFEMHPGSNECGRYYSHQRATQEWLPPSCPSFCGEAESESRVSDSLTGRQGEIDEGN